MRFILRCLHDLTWAELVNPSVNSNLPHKNVDTQYEQPPPLTSSPTHPFTLLLNELITHLPLPTNGVGPPPQKPSAQDIGRIYTTDHLKTGSSSACETLRQRPSPPPSLPKICKRHNPYPSIFPKRSDAKRAIFASKAQTIKSKKNLKSQFEKMLNCDVCTIFQGLWDAVLQRRAEILRLDR